LHGLIDTSTARRVKASIERRLAEDAKRDRERLRMSRDLDRIRKKCETLSGFIEEAWPVLEPNTDYVRGWHIDAMAEHLTAISRGQLNRLVINVPPGMMKSLGASVFWPAFEWGPFGRPDLRYLTASYQEGYAGRDARKMRDLVRSEWFQTLWPLELLRVGEMSFENTHRGNREAKPYRSLTAGRGNRVIIDDPHSTETAESEPELARASRVFRESVQSRLNDQKRDAIIVIMQRLGANDVCGTIEQYGMNYERLILPMRFEEDRRCVTSIGWRDPRRVDGELLFPEKFPEEVVASMERAMGSHAVAGQLQQRPSPREGAMFKRAWFSEDRFIKAPPSDVIKWVRHWDLAATARKRKTLAQGPARTCGVKMGLRSNGRYVVAHCIKGQWEGDSVKTIIRATAKQDGPSVEVSLPQDPGQAGKVQVNDFTRALAGFVVHAEPETGSKEIRAEPFATQVEAGNVDFVEGAWNAEYIDELCDFPSGKLKDQVDASSGAFGRLTSASTYTLDYVR
jgi:predicted phage terminase large subunit-like protein